MNLLLKCLARAVLKNAGKFLVCLVPGGEVLYEVAVDTWEEYSQECQQDALRLDLEALAVAPAEEVRQEVNQVVQEQAAGQTPEVRNALAAYLGQVPAMIHRTLRRPSDPGGTTMPANWRLQKGEDLIPFLPPRPPRFKAGDRPLAGVDWELEELLGVGGFGEVWKARHRYLKSKPPVALKFCLEESAARSLWNEAGVLDRVMQHGRHPGIVSLQMTYLEVTPPCLEYEYVEGGDLTGLIQELDQTGELTAAAASQLFVQLVEIVAHAHRAEPPIVHCDLKPANILVQPGANGRPQLRIADFGIGGVAAQLTLLQTRARSSGAPGLLTQSVRGAYTPLYASPQQIERQRGDAPDPRDDVHALGVIWYQLVTGNLRLVTLPPDWREELERRGLDDKLIRLLGSCISSRAEQRPVNAVALLDRLRVALDMQKDDTGSTVTPVTSALSAAQLRQMLLGDLGNKPLRKEYLARRTPELAEADLRYGRPRLTLTRSLRGLIGFLAFGLLGGALAILFTAVTGHTVQGVVGLVIVLATSCAGGGAVGFALLAAVGHHVFGEFFEEESQEDEGEGPTKRSRLGQILGAITGPLLEMAGGLVWGAFCGAAVGASGALVVVLSGLSLEEQALLLVAGAVGGGLVGLLLVAAVVLLGKLEKTAAAWAALGPFPWSAYWLPPERMEKKHCG